MVSRRAFISGIIIYRLLRYSMTSSIDIPLVEIQFCIVDVGISKSRPHCEILFDSPLCFTMTAGGCTGVSKAFSAGHFFATIRLYIPEYPKPNSSDHSRLSTSFINGLQFWWLICGKLSGFGIYVNPIKRWTWSRLLLPFFLRGTL